MKTLCAALCQVYRCQFLFFIYFPLAALGVVEYDQHIQTHLWHMSIKSIQLGFALRLTALFTFNIWCFYKKPAERKEKKNLNILVAGTVPRWFGWTEALLFFDVGYLIISLCSVAYLCKTPLCVHYPSVRKSIKPWGEDLFTHTIRKLTLWRR